jgi:renalase
MTMGRVTQLKPSMPDSQRHRIAVIGAGAAGLIAASQLQRDGFDVTVFEKARGAGGRMSTRRLTMADGQVVSFDHGAQHVSLRESELQPYLADWRALGLLNSWRFRQLDLQDNRREEIERLVFVPTMSALAKALAKDLRLLCNTQVTHLARDKNGLIELLAGSAYLGTFDHLLVTAPAPQAAVLLSSIEPRLHHVAGSVTYQPCLAAMVAFDRPIPDDVDAYRRGKAISWAARNSAKPGRSNAPDCWVIHATPAWSREHISLKGDEIVVPLLAEFAKEAQLELPSLLAAAGHRWLYSFVGKGLEHPAHRSDDGRISLAGDFASSPSVGGALRSGLHAAELITATMRPSEVRVSG